LSVAITIGAAAASAPQPTAATAATTAGEDEESSSTESRCRRNIPENTSPKSIRSREQKKAARDAKKTSGSGGSTALLPPSSNVGVGVDTELPSPTEASTSGHEVVVRPCLEEAYFDSGLYAAELDVAPVKQWPWEKVAQFVRMLVR
jgi:hypothetical protein